MKLKQILIFLIFSTSIYATTSIDIELFLPKKDYRSTKQVILFKGKLKNASKLSINGHSIPIYKSRFYQKAILNPHQQNSFTFTATNDLGQSKSIERIIEYFPDTTTKQPSYFNLNYIHYDQKSNQWTLSGKAPLLKSLYINSIDIPINKENTFEFRFSNSTQQSSLNVSAITNDLLFFSQEIGLFQHSESKPKEVAFEKDKTKFELIQKAIIESFKDKNWNQIPVTTIQQKMINELITTKENNLSISKIKLLQNKEFIAVLIPCTAKNLDLKTISFQVMNILQNTNNTAKTISILWYNSLPNIIEIVYDDILGSDTYYWLINDIRISEENLNNKNIISEFNKNAFI